MWKEYLPSGKVRYVERYTDPLTGKQCKVSISLDKDTNSNRKQAQLALQDKISKKVMQKTTPEQITLEMLVEKYLEEQKQTLKLSTYRRNSYTCTSILNIFGKDTLVNKLTAHYIKSTLTGLDKTAKQKNELLKRFKGLLNWGYTNDYIADISYLGKVEKLKTEPHKESITDKFLESSELKQLVSAMNHEVWRETTLFLALSGLRFGEFVALSKSDVDFKNRYIHVTNTYDHNNKVFTKAKTGSSIDDVYMQDELFKVAKRINILMNERRLLCMTRSDLFIFNLNGGPLYYPTYGKYLSEIAQKTLGRHITPHVLRHTHASLLMEQGISIDTISRRLRHSDSKITRDIYLHITEKLKEKENQMLKEVQIL